MNPIEEIKAKLTKYPHVRYVESANTIEVEAPRDTGFAVGFTCRSSDYIVYFDGWHEHFDSAEDALGCFAFGLIGQNRLKVTYRGSTPTKYTLQYLDGDVWCDDSTTGLVFQPFWRRTRTEIRENPPLADDE